MVVLVIMISSTIESLAPQWYSDDIAFFSLTLRLFTIDAVSDMFTPVIDTFELLECLRDK